MWRDDLPMLDDPVCVSVEFSETQTIADDLISFFDYKKDEYQYYSSICYSERTRLRPMLGKGEGPMQDHMMQKILGRELLMD
jgi:hypothetical protein